MQEHAGPLQKKRPGSPGDHRIKIVFESLEMRVTFGIIDGAGMLIRVKINGAAPQAQTDLKLGETNMFFV
jgi:hypothetical protein